MKSGVWVCDAIEQLRGRIENGRLTFSEERVAQSRAVMPEGQTTGREFFGDELFLRQEVGVDVAPNEPTPLQQPGPEQRSDKATEGDGRQPVSNGRPDRSAWGQGSDLRSGFRDAGPAIIRENSCAPWT